ncbi:hypothetical protein MGAD_14220 [Mycolicibacterium gadium]|uniref:Uncharacterized protein n=1 Tax=Mycolicibacterium gadium TaxID=1794 RepID=A0A7I7WJT6_MYCGU|nr:hypothetical protein MGAD_14220 [Mycolicibacterium gadium]
MTPRDSLVITVKPCDFQLRLRREADAIEPDLKGFTVRDGRHASNVALAVAVEHRAERFDFNVARIGSGAIRQTEENAAHMVEGPEVNLHVRDANR